MKNQKAASFRASAAKVLNILLPVLFGVVFIVIWETGGLHSLMNLKKYQLPVPSQIVKTFGDNLPKLLKNGRFTVTEALWGLVIGSAIGFITAVLATLFPKWGYGGLTALSAFNAVPIVALSPVMNNWFGMGMGSKIAVVVVTTMAAMAFNAYRGLNDLKPFSLDLMKSYASDKKTIFLKLRLPNCLPNVLTALKISTTSSMIAAIVSEFFASYAGIGFELSNALKTAKMPLAWAYITLAAIIGIAMYLLVTLVERFAIQWHASQKNKN